MKVDIKDEADNEMEISVHSAVAKNRQDQTSVPRRATPTGFWPWR